MEELAGKKASLAIFVASETRRIVPREFQLRATMALCSGKDALIDVGSGYGKVQWDARCSRLLRTDW
jgi:hypothetical protein